MWIKIHRSYRTVVSVCDSDILGKTFEEGNRQLHVRENFYKDREVDKTEAIRIMQFQVREDATFNIVGHEAIEVAKEAGIITEANIGKVAGIPFALLF